MREPDPPQQPSAEANVEQWFSQGWAVPARQQLQLLDEGWYRPFYKFPEEPGRWLNGPD